MWVLEQSNWSSTAPYGEFYPGVAPATGSVNGDSEYVLTAGNTWKHISTIGSASQQPDWTEDDSSQADYIRNKPLVRDVNNATELTAVSGVRIQPGNTAGLHIHRVTQQGVTRIEYDVEIRCLPAAVHCCGV